MLHNRHRLFYAVAALALLSLVGARGARAQDAVIRGTVTSDRGEAVQVANVYIEELRIAVTTGANGQYTLNVPGARVRGQQVVLRVRGIGFKPNSKMITLTPGEQTVDITLAYDVNLLEAVVVTGVTEATSQLKTPFSVTRIDASQLPVPAADPLRQLQGKIGANIVSNSGRPGSQPAVLLRGPTSINASGRSQDPLYIVDGVIINGSLPDLNPADIESVEVVKGAAGASLYGARAGNGVINIKTKSGTRALEGVKFTMRSEAGQSDIERDFGLAHFHALMTDETGTRFCQSTTGQPQCGRTFDYLEVQSQINNIPGDFAGSPPGFPVDPGSTIGGNVLRQRYQISAWPGTSYNAVKQLAVPHPYMQNTIDMTGRFGLTRFYTSASNYRDEGAIRFLQGFERNAFRANVDQTIGTDWSVSLRTSFSRNTQDGLNQEQGNAFFRLTRVPAIVDITQRDTLGRLFIRPNLQGGGGQNQNPLQTLENTQRSDVTSRFLGGLSVQYTPADWFSMDGQFGYDLRRVTFSQFNDKGFRTTTADPATNNGFIFRGASGQEAVDASLNATFRRELSTGLKSRYTLRYLFEQRDADLNQGQGNFLAVKSVTSLGNATANKDISSSFTRIRQIGLFAAADFEYLDRYIVGATVRRDGSSLFGSGNRWATFGRGSVAWRVSQEPWWFFPSINEFKLRTSYGTAGSSPRFTAQYETFNNGDGGIITLNVLGNRQLQPEIHHELEVGADMELLNRFGLQATYSHTDVEGQILPVPVSSSTGYASQWQNAGTLTNKTWELTLNVPLVQRRDVSWTMSMVYDRNRSVVTKLVPPPFRIGTGQQGTGDMFLIQEGERFGTFYGRRFLTSCAELPAPFNTDCGGPTSAFQRNDEGFLVWVGAGNNPGMGITNNLWETQLPGCGTVAVCNTPAAFTAPWGVALNWGMPIMLRGDANNVNDARQVALGNALPDFRFAITQNVRWKALTVYALLDAAIGQRIWNEGFHWAHLDFLSSDVDQRGKSVQAAKPIGYYYRAGAPDAGGLGGFYDILAPNSFSVEDGSYAKLRELMVSYHVGAVGGFGDWEVSVVGRNLFTITGYRGFDPETGISGGDSGSAAINNVDAFQFPNLRQFTFALSTGF